LRHVGVVGEQRVEFFFAKGDFAGGGVFAIQPL
jgi:hypothetical protein